MISTLFAYLNPHIDENNHIADLKSMLQKAGAYPAFEGIYTTFSDQEADAIAHFIIFMYCPDSTYFVVSDNYANTKLGIAELCGLDLQVHEKVIHLTVPEVVTAVKYVSYEFKSWKAYKIVTLRESAANLERLSMEEPDPKIKNAAKNIRDAAIYSIELSTKADLLAQEIIKTTRSKERLKEVAQTAYTNTSMEQLLLEVT